MSNVDWYRRKLAEQNPHQPQPLRRTEAPISNQPPPQYQQPQQQYQQPVQEEVEDFGPVTASNIWEAVRRFKGNKKGALQETSSCPSCGSYNYFSRSNSALIKSDGSKVNPAPLCANCGYNGVFEQYSDHYNEDRH